MAGYALGFDDGGDVDADEQAQGGAESYAIPEDESAGLDTSARQPQDQGYWGNNFNEAQRGVQQVGGAAKRVLSYLLGQGSASPPVAQQVVQQVKANDPQMSDDDANLMAVHEAGAKGGPAAAWAMLQYNRNAYNAKQSFAKAALNGVDGKAGDLAAAAQAATQAGSHVLDGSSAVFTAAPEGITATVRKPGGGTDQYRLTPQQFNDYLDTGKQGLWDRVMQNGISGALGQITGQATNGEDTAPSDAETVNETSNGTPMGQTPSTMDLSGGQKGLRGYAPMDYNPMEDDKATSQTRANYLFPSTSPQDAAGRRQYMMNEEEREAQGQIKKDVARLGAEGRQRVAETNATARRETAADTNQARRDIQHEKSGAYERVHAADREAKAKAAQDKALQIAQQMEQRGSDARMREAGRMARAELSNPNFLLQKPEDQQAILKKYGIDRLMMGQQSAAQAAPAAPAAPAQGGQRPDNIPPGAKLYKGKWYTRGPNGEAVPVQ